MSLNIFLVLEIINNTFRILFFATSIVFLKKLHNYYHLNHLINKLRHLIIINKIRIERK